MTDGGPMSEGNLSSITDSMPSLESLFDDRDKMGEGGAVTDEPISEDALVEDHTPATTGADNKDSNAQAAADAGEAAQASTGSGEEGLVDGSPSFDDLTQEGADEPPGDSQTPEPITLDGSQPPSPPETVDAHAIHETYNQTLESTQKQIASKYTPEATQLVQRGNQIKQQLEALRNGAVENYEDPQTGEIKQRERPYLPSEIDRRDALVGDLKSVENRAGEIMRQRDIDFASAETRAWTEMVISLNPQLKPYQHEVEQMASSGQVSAGGNGKVDLSELYVRAKYRHDKTNPAGAQGQAAKTSEEVAPTTEPAKPAYTPEQVQEAKANTQNARIRERGLGTVTAGRGGAGDGKAKGKEDVPAWRKGASDEVIKGLNKLEMALAED